MEFTKISDQAPTIRNPSSYIIMDENRVAANSRVSMKSVKELDRKHLSFVVFFQISHVILKLRVGDEAQAGQLGSNATTP
jgi:hypothetical protein